MEVGGCLTGSWKESTPYFIVIVIRIIEKIKQFCETDVFCVFHVLD